MAAHIRSEHKDCRDETCGYCLGGLFTCEVCGASEGELPKECPGTEMTEKQRRAVMAGHLDFFGGQWRCQKFHEGGERMFEDDGTMIETDGSRSIFDDIDE